MNVIELPLEERIKTKCSHLAVVSYADLVATAGTAKTLQVFPYIARDIVDFAFFDLVKTFDGGATSELTVQFGHNGVSVDDADSLIPAKSIHEDGTEILADAGGATAVDAGTVDGTYGAEEAAAINSMRVSLNQVLARRLAFQEAGYLELVFTSTGANLTALTQGLIHVFFNVIRPTDVRPLSAP